MRHQFLIDPPQHGDPHRAAAACQLVVLVGEDVRIEFQRLFQGQDVGKERDLHHARKAQRFERRAQFAGRDLIGKLADDRRRDNGVDRRAPAVDQVERGQDVLAFDQVFRFAALHAGGASHAHLAVHLYIAVFVGVERVEQALPGAVGRLLFGAVAVAHAPDRGVFFRVQQAVEVMGVKILLAELFQLLFALAFYGGAH